jgi:Zinc carboxypeptidase
MEVATPQEPGELAWFLPEGALYDASFPTPQSVLGWEVGQWHVRHDQLLQWFQKVAATSPRVKLESYGQTYEQRPLLLATVSSPENLARIEEIRQAHVRAVLDGDENYAGPAVVWMGYSVHGNEASGSNAALLLAYHLAAAQGEQIEEFLRNTVVLIDPCLNPDGLSRFAQWANMHRGKQLVGDPSHREHQEAWPGGRTNHYWFDLNRDWLLLTHPESRGRLAKFHAWMPQVLTDFHEMGTDSTYFFQPGIPSRQNPLTPVGNLELTRKIATYHTAALDQIGSLFYTEESYDDFYYGKGSTYPDLNGSIGILFEQASARGHVQENSFGGISFPFAIRNQLTASLSTLKAVDEMRADLSNYQRKFFRTARADADAHPVRAYVVSAPDNPTRLREFASILDRHHIQVHRLARTIPAVETKGSPFMAADSLLIPLQQTQFRLIRALFETRTTWDDNTFYDVSSWTLPLAFDLPVRALGETDFSKDLLGEVWHAAADSAAPTPVPQAPVAWIFEWQDDAAPKALQILLDAGVRARVSTKPFHCETSVGNRDFALGSIVIAAGIQDLKPEPLLEILQQAAATGVQIYAATRGLTPDGVDLGSGSFRPLQAPKPLMLIGSGVSSYQAGEVWHLLDQGFGLALTMAEKSSFKRLDLARYTHLILVSGASSSFDEKQIEAIQRWVRKGGILIATKNSAKWAAETLLANATPKKVMATATGAGAAGVGAAGVGAAADVADAKKQTAEKEAAEPEPSEDAAPPAYADYEKLRAVDQIAGAIFETRLDLTHPMCFGFSRDHLPVFRNSTAILPMGVDPFAMPVRYSKTPLLSGYASEKSVAKISPTPAVRAERLGAGTIICMIDNPNFRGVWYGTSKLFANALYFGTAIKRTGPIEDPPKD